MKKILIVSFMVFLCCVTTVGCSYSNPRQQIEEDVYYSASETNNKISYKDYEAAKFCSESMPPKMVPWF